MKQRDLKMKVLMLSAFSVCTAIASYISVASLTSEDTVHLSPGKTT